MDDSPETVPERHDSAELEDGDYRIQLFGVEDGEVTPLQERYEMTLVRW